MIADSDFWIVTIALGIGTFLIRFSFLGILGGRSLPGWLTLHLKYVGVAVFPALVMPQLVWPAATGGVTDPTRLIAAAATILVGLRFGVIWSIVAGMAALYSLQYFL